MVDFPLIRDIINRDHFFCLTNLASFRRRASDTHPEGRCPARPQEFSCVGNCHEGRSLQGVTLKTRPGLRPPASREMATPRLPRTLVPAPWGHADARRPCVTPRTQLWQPIPGGWAGPTIPPRRRNPGRASLTASRARNKYFD